jgi:hypothetical protein
MLHKPKILGIITIAAYTLFGGNFHVERTATPAELMFQDSNLCLQHYSYLNFNLDNQIAVSVKKDEYLVCGFENLHRDIPIEVINDFVRQGLYEVLGTYPGKDIDLSIELNRGANTSMTVEYGVKGREIILESIMIALSEGRTFTEAVSALAHENIHVIQQTEINPMFEATEYYRLQNESNQEYNLVVFSLSEKLAHLGSNMLAGNIAVSYDPQLAQKIYQPYLKSDILGFLSETPDNELRHYAGGERLYWNLLYNDASLREMAQRLHEQPDDWQLRFELDRAMYRQLDKRYHEVKLIGKEADLLEHEAYDIVFREPSLDIINFAEKYAQTINYP